MSIQAAGAVQSKIPNDIMMTLVIPYVGEPGKLSRVCKLWRDLQNGSYKFITEGYVKSGVSMRIKIEVPSNISVNEYKQLVQQIYSAAVKATPSHRLFRKHSLNPLALAPLLEHADKAENQLKNAKTALDRDKQTIQRRSAGSRVVNSSARYSNSAATFDLLTCSSDKRLAALEEQHANAQRTVQRKLIETARSLSAEDNTSAAYTNLPASILQTSVKPNYFK
jgi:hypothetical protein